MRDEILRFLVLKIVNIYGENLARVIIFLFTFNRTCLRAILQEHHRS